MFRGNRIKIVGILVFAVMFQLLSGCANSDTDTFNKNKISGSQNDTNQLEDGKSKDINADRKKFIDTYYPIMVDYNTKATEFIAASNNLQEFYEQSGHDYGNQGVIDQMDIYYQIACDKYKNFDDFLKRNPFLNKNIKYFEKLFKLENHSELLNIFNTLKENYEGYREDFINGKIVSGGALEGAYDIGFTGIVNASTQLNELGKLMGIALDPKEKCYEYWMEYTYSYIDDCEAANKQLMKAYSSSNGK
jgi:hypothetical protein